MMRRACDPAKSKASPNNDNCSSPVGRLDCGMPVFVSHSARASSNQPDHDSHAVDALPCSQREPPLTRGAVMDYLSPLHVSLCLRRARQAGTTGCRMRLGLSIAQKAGRECHQERIRDAWSLPPPADQAVWLAMCWLMPASGSHPLSCLVYVKSPGPCPLRRFPQAFSSTRTIKRWPARLPCWRPSLPVD